MENKNSILQFTSIFYAAFTILGFSYTKSYFNFFGVDIYSYLDFSEISLCFLNTMDSIIATIIVVIVIIFIGLIPDVLYLLTSDVRIKRVTRKFQFVFIIIAFGIVIYFVYFSGIGVFASSLYAMIFNCFCFLFFIYQSYKNKKVETLLEKYNIKSVKGVEYILVFFFALSINYIFSIYDSEMIKGRIKIAKISFDYENKKVQNNDTIVYVGSTNKYIFLHNLKSKDNFIYEKSNIKNLKFKKH